MQIPKKGPSGMPLYHCVRHMHAWVLSSRPLPYLLQASQLRLPIEAQELAACQHDSCLPSCIACLQGTVRHWNAVECSSELPEAAGSCARHLAYLRKTVPVLTGFTGLGLPHPSHASHSGPDRPSTVKGTIDRAWGPACMRDCVCLGSLFENVWGLCGRCGLGCRV